MEQLVTMKFESQLHIMKYYDSIKFCGHQSSDGKAMAQSLFELMVTSDP